MKRILISLMLVTSLSLGGSLFKEDNDEKTHIAIGTMTGAWANIIAKSNGASDLQALVISIGASVAVGAIASGGNMDLVSDAIGGVAGYGASYVIYRF